MGKEYFDRSGQKSEVKCQTKMNVYYYLKLLIFNCLGREIVISTINIQLSYFILRPELFIDFGCRLTNNYPTPSGPEGSSGKYEFV